MSTQSTFVQGELSHGPVVIRKVKDAVAGQAKGFWVEEVRPLEAHEAKTPQWAERHRKRCDERAEALFQKALNTKLYELLKDLRGNVPAENFAAGGVGPRCTALVVGVGGGEVICQGVGVTGLRFGMGK